MYAEEPSKDIYFVYDLLYALLTGTRTLTLEQNLKVLWMRRRIEILLKCPFL